MSIEAVIVSAFSFVYKLISFFLSLWWIYLPIILFFFVRDLWIKHKRDQWIQSLEWVNLEVIPPQEIKKTPYAMEQFFAALHGSQSSPNKWGQVMNGETQRWFSFEIVSLGGEVHFFICTPATFRNFIESQIYAQYPDAEISEVDDYVNMLPPEIPNEDYNLWGTELVFTDDFAYPIRTYPVFNKDVLDVEERIDPLASLMETMSKLKGGENIWIQTLIRPIGGGWKKEGEKTKNKLINRAEPAPSPNFLLKEITAWFEAFYGVIYRLLNNEAPPIKAEEKAEEKTDKLTKAEGEKVKAVEDKISKIGYETIIRFIYVARKDVFDIANVPAVVGNFKQLSTQNLNGFKPNAIVTTKIDYKIQGKDKREFIRKKRILFDYRRRFFPQYSSFIPYLRPLIFQKLPFVNKIVFRYKPMIMNIEELATVYHFPGISVEAPFVPRVEAKKAEPPRTLPTE